MTNWLTYSILIPLFPIITAVLITLLKGEAIHIQSILGGTDLFILSIVLLATTRNDIESFHQLSWSSEITAEWQRY